MDAKMYEFIIPSKTVREYLTEIGHQFTEREIATLINCRGITSNIDAIHTAGARKTLAWTWHKSYECIRFERGTRNCRT